MRAPENIPLESGLATVHPSESSEDSGPAGVLTDLAFDLLLHPRPSAVGVHERSRTRTIIKLAECRNEEASKAARSMRDCLAYPAIYLASDGSLVPVLGRCRHRLCPLCAAARSRLVTARVLDSVNAWDSIRHLVLTLKHSDDPLGVQLDRLIASYRRLRQTVMWKERCDAAIATIEITYNPSSAQWHPHLHVLATGDYLPHAAVRDGWRKSTGDSDIVHLSRIDSRTAAARYVGKYVAKPAELADWPAAVINEYLRGTQGRRLLIATGTAHKARLARLPDSERPKLVRQVASWHHIRRAWEAGRPYAVALVERVASDWPLVVAHVQYETDAPPGHVPSDHPDRSRSTVDLLAACKGWCDSGHDPPWIRASLARVELEPGLWTEAACVDVRAFAH